jgi:ribosome-associated protein
MARREARARSVRAMARTRDTAAVPVEPRPAPRNTQAARNFAVACAKLMRDDHCDEIVVLDLLGVSPICDYFVIGTGTSDRQMRAVADHIRQMAKTCGETPYCIDGYEEGVWIIVDFVDTVIHLFDEERRLFYDLESLWGDRPTIDWTK